MYIKSLCSWNLNSISAWSAITQTTHAYISSKHMYSTLSSGSCYLQCTYMQDQPTSSHSVVKQCRVHTLSLFHIRYHFDVSNRVGSVEGSVVLEVQEGEEKGESTNRPNFDSNPVTQKEFGEYVESLHSCNNSTFILQYQVQSHHHCSFKICTCITLSSYCSPWHQEKRAERFDLGSQKLINL